MFEDVIKFEKGCGLMKLKNVMLSALLTAAGCVLTGALWPAGMVSCCEAQKLKEKRHDSFYWLGEINKASLVINSRQGLLTQDEAVFFARGLERVLAKGRMGGERPGLVITFEPLLIAEAGEEVTKVHAGRSSQDMLMTCRLMKSREQLLELADALNGLSARLLAMADEQREAVVPSYTNGVAAQPESYGHYLLAYADAFARDAERLQQYYARLNRSPMGTTVLNGSGWPLDREAMAEYLGFDGIAYNAYDAVQVYSLEAAVEAGSVINPLAIHVGSFIEDVMQQYAQPRPWLLLEEGGANTYVSSAMPQKRNPGILNRVRTNASTLLGDVVGAAFRAHNIPPGMADARNSAQDRLLAGGIKLVEDFTHILQALKLNRERALEELNLDWTATQEIADILMRDYGVPFRVGHHFASEIVSYARPRGLTPLTLTYAEAREVYRRAVEGHPGAPGELPLSEAQWHSALEPAGIVQGRATLGGPQPSEISKMLTAGRKRLEENQRWLQRRQAQLQAADRRLQSDFQQLKAGE